LDAADPARVADLVQRLQRDIVLVGLALPEGVVAELEVRDQDPIDEQAGAHPGAEGDHQLDPTALDHAEALDVRVVARARRPVSSATRFARSKPLQSPSRFGAVLVTPSATTPGKPIETRAKSGIFERSWPIVAITAAGVAGRGVSRRARSLIGRPSGSRTIA